MDIAIVSKDSLKIKIKKTSLLLNPRTDMSKTDADAILAADNSIDQSRVNDYRVLINGAGEYEVSGLKIVVTRFDGSLLFNFIQEGVDVILAKASTLSKIPSDKVKDYQIAIIEADADLLQSVITAMESRIIVLYGEHAVAAAKNLSKEGLVSASKVSFSEDKLPEETEIYLLS